MCVGYCCFVVGVCSIVCFGLIGDLLMMEWFVFGVFGIFNGDDGWFDIFGELVG